jgi:hypothetical protein
VPVEQFAEEGDGEGALVAEDQEVVEVEAGGRVRAELDAGVVAAVAGQLEAGAALDRTDLDGDAGDREQRSPQQVGQERLQLQRERGPLVEQHPQLSWADGVHHLVQRGGQRPEDDVVMLLPAADDSVGPLGLVSTPSLRRQVPPRPDAHRRAGAGALLVRGGDDALVLDLPHDPDVGRRLGDVVHRLGQLLQAVIQVQLENGLPQRGVQRLDHVDEQVRRPPAHRDAGIGVEASGGPDVAQVAVTGDVALAAHRLRQVLQDVRLPGSPAAVQHLVLGQLEHRHQRFDGDERPPQRVRVRVLGAFRDPHEQRVEGRGGHGDLDG